MIILDTNVISEGMRPSPEKVVMRWVDAQRPSNLFTTAVTQAEIFNGVKLMPVGKRSVVLFAAAEQIFEKAFAGRILPFDHTAARFFAEIFSSRKLRGKPIKALDAQIAAIVRAHNAILATRNTRDFEGCGIHLINPWQAT